MNYLSFINNFKRKYLKYRSGSIHQFQFIFYRMSFTRLCQLIKYCWWKQLVQVDFTPIQPKRTCLSVSTTASPEGLYLLNILP